MKNNLIGKIILGRFPYFDIMKRENRFKVRPMLVIGKADKKENPDFNVLPLSTIKDKSKINPRYDYKFKLRKESYIRIHKQNIINIRSVEKVVIDFKEEYKNDWEEIRKLHFEYNNTLFI